MQASARLPAAYRVIADIPTWLGIVHSKSNSGYVTGSFGVCSMVPADAATRSDLLQRADGAFYEAKRAGPIACAPINLRESNGGNVTDGQDAVYR